MDDGWMDAGNVTQDGWMLTHPTADWGQTCVTTEQELGLSQQAVLDYKDPLLRQMHQQVTTSVFMPEFTFRTLGVLWMR